MNRRDFKVLAAVLVPPLGVFWHQGAGWSFWLNLLLTLFGYVPGLIHAIWLINQPRRR